MKKHNETFGRVLKRLRQNSKLSLKQLSPKLDINYSYLSKLENNHSLPSEQFIHKISNLFNYDSEELMIRAGKIPKDIIDILKNNPKEAAEFLRKTFSNDE